MACAPGTRVSEGWAPGQRATTWGQCRLLKGRAARRPSAGAAFPARPSAARPSPGASCAPGSRPSVAPARPRAHLQPPTPGKGRGLTPPPSGAPWAGLTPGSPRLPPRAGLGRGTLARCRLRAGRQVSAGTGRAPGRTPGPVPILIPAPRAGLPPQALPRLVPRHRFPGPGHPGCRGRWASLRARSHSAHAREPRSPCASPGSPAPAPRPCARRRSVSAPNDPRARVPRSGWRTDHWLPALGLLLPAAAPARPGNRARSAGAS